MHDIDDAEMERRCEVLEWISQQFAPDSDEGLAIRNSALALTIATPHAMLRKSYDQLIAAGVLTDEMRDRLRHHGVDTDALDEERSNAATHARANNIEDIAEMERVLGVLERISQRYAPGSEEALAIRHAALAHPIVIQQASLRKAYNKLLMAFDGAFTDEMREEMRLFGEKTRSYGIDRDAPDDEEPDAIP